MEIKILKCDRCRRTVKRFKIQIVLNCPGLLNFSFLSLLSLKSAGFRTSYCICDRCYKKFRAFMKEDPSIDPLAPEAIELVNGEVIERE